MRSRGGSRMARVPSFQTFLRVTSILPSGLVNVGTYTDGNQLKTAKLGSTLLATRSYDSGARLTSTALDNGLVESRTYRADNLLASIATPGISQLTYAYDANKRVANEASPLLPAEALTYGYDVEDRLTTFKRGPTATPTQSQSWNLSPVTLTQNGQTLSWDIENRHIA